MDKVDKILSKYPEDLDNLKEKLNKANVDRIAAEAKVYKLMVQIEQILNCVDKVDPSLTGRIKRILGENYEVEER